MAPPNATARTATDCATSNGRMLSWAVTIEIIQKYVADYYNLKLTELKSRNNAKSVSMPRQVAMYLCKSLTHASLPEIGRQFGGKHHTTVLHSVEKIEKQRQTDKDLNRLLNKMTEQLGG